MNADELIERMEKETGQRVDDNGGENFAIAALMGALTREMGYSQHSPRDDVPAGIVARHQMSPEYEEEQRSKLLMAKMFVAGLL